MDSNLQIDFNFKDILLQRKQAANTLMRKRKSMYITEERTYGDLKKVFVFKKKVRLESILKSPLKATGICPLALLAKNNHRLPTEILLNVFSFLNYHDHQSIMQTCIRWRKIGSHSIAAAKIEVNFNLLKKNLKLMTPARKEGPDKKDYLIIKKKSSLFSNIKAGI